MDIRQLRTFVEVAANGSYARTALIVGIAQSALSRQLSALERGIGGRLFHRTGRGVVLTEAALPDGTWIDVLQLARGAVDAAVIVTDRLADAHFWAEALNLGAYDVLAQPFYVSEVRRVLSNACTRVLSEWSRCAVL